jgi:putative ABC transport system permease protein
MFKNYLKTAVRSLIKNKTFSAINIIGLLTGTLAGGGFEYGGIV